MNLADEPTGALDTKTGEKIMDLFNRLHELRNTIIVVTHEEHIAQYSEAINQSSKPFSTHIAIANADVLDNNAEFRGRSLARQ